MFIDKNLEANVEDVDKLKDYRLLFFGLLFYINIRVFNVDILPNTLGFIFFMIGLRGLMNNNQHYKKALRLTYPLIILSLVSLYKDPSVKVVEYVLGAPGLNAMINLAVSILALIQLYYIVKGLIADAGAIGNRDFEKKALGRWKWYCRSNVIKIIFLPVCMLFYGYIYLLVPILLAVVISYLSLLQLLWQGAKVLATDNN